MKIRRGVGIALVGAGLVVLSCSADRGSVPLEARTDASVSTASAGAIIDSPAAVARIADLRTRFRTALGAPVATRFEAATGDDAATHVRAVLPSEALRGVSRPGHVDLPRRATDEVMLEDDTSHVSVRLVLDHVRDARVELAGGMAIYRGALDGADVVHRVNAEGTEDFVVFEARPAREELSYSVDVSHVPGLRLVSNTLEFLDESGTPVLRVAPPYLVDAKGERHVAKLAVSGCAYDASPVGPWGRKVTTPGAKRCSVRIAWVAGIAYPALVDPAWSATGSMAAARGGQRHTASVLPSGKVLVAGGGAGALAAAELFSPAGNAGGGTFAATGSMATGRYTHTASVLPSGKVLVAGGNGAGGAALASAEVFDGVAGTFAPTGSMGAARWGHTASVLSVGKVLVVGGYTGSVSLASAELFDPAGNAGAGTFTVTGSMAVQRTEHTASVLPSGKVLVAGGYATTDNSQASAELFDPAGNAGVGTFAATGSMGTARSQHTSTVLSSGKVLITGGFNLSANLSSAELFDPAGNAGAGTFAATGAMTATRFRHVASALPSGRVLVAAGLGVGTTFLTSAELFDPAGNVGAGSFVATGSMATGRYFPTATVLPSGKVLVTGGQGSAGALASAELFGGVVGDACTANNCFSGVCADGFCCSTACSGGDCDRCDLVGKEGTCSIAPSGNPGANAACASPLACDGVNAACPTSCASDAACAQDFYCTPNGTCAPRKAQASPCNPQTACKAPGCRECASGFCVDGFCCDTACNVVCQACSAARKQTGVVDGTCGPTKDGTDPHAGCLKGQVCNGSGSCASPPSGTATCDGDHITTGADGATQDCTPFKCDSNGTCRSTCSSVNDCVAPTICDPNGKCVAPAADTGNSGGCSMSATRTGNESSPFAWLALGLGLLAIRSRARRGENGAKE